MRVTGQVSLKGAGLGRWPSDANWMNLGTVDVHQEFEVAVLGGGAQDRDAWPWVHRSWAMMTPRAWSMTAREASGVKSLAGRGGAERPGVWRGVEGSCGVRGEAFPALGFRAQPPTRRGAGDTQVESPDVMAVGPSAVAMTSTGWGAQRPASRTRPSVSSPVMSSDMDHLPGAHGMQGRARGPVPYCTSFICSARVCRLLATSQDGRRRRLDRDPAGQASEDPTDGQDRRVPGGSLVRSAYPVAGSAAQRCSRRRHFPLALRPSPHARPGKQAGRQAAPSHVRFTMARRVAGQLPDTSKAVHPLSLLAARVRRTRPAVLVAGAPAGRPSGALPGVSDVPGDENGSGRKRRPARLAAARFSDVPASLLH